MSSNMRNVCFYNKEGRDGGVKSPRLVQEEKAGVKLKCMHYKIYLLATNKIFLLDHMSDSLTSFSIACLSSNHMNIEGYVWMSIKLFNWFSNYLIAL